MYCEKCGSKLEGDKCPNCGSVVNNMQAAYYNNIQKPVFKTGKVKYAAYNTYVFIATVAAFIIMRLSCQESTWVPAGMNGRWRGGYEYYVPGNIQGIMIVLLGASLFAMVTLYKGGKCNKTAIVWQMIIETIVGIFAAFIGGST